jgi:RNA polymerase-interacting CarD/CdnL/TRCF family regulator
MSKMARERAVKERRARKLEKKHAAAAKRKEARDASTPRPSPTPARPGSPRTVNLAVGDRVVYGNHGVGRIALRPKQKVAGEVKEVVVLELDELTVTLPLELARTQLRPLATEAELRSVREALRTDGALNPGNWLSRKTVTVAKLTGGTPVELAEVVSEGAQRERLRQTNGGKAQLSPSEREIFSRARFLLSQEIGLVLEIDSAAAEAWIERHLARPA